MGWAAVSHSLDERFNLHVASSARHLELCRTQGYFLERGREFAFRPASLNDNAACRVLSRVHTTNPVPCPPSHERASALRRINLGGED